MKNAFSNMRSAVGSQVLFVICGLILAGGVGLLYVTRQRARELRVLGKVGAFQLSDRTGKVMSNKELEGQVWVASFIFTRCSGPCPQISATMASLQQDPALSKLQLVSFSVDPEWDTPAVLANYAENFRADSHRWHFLTGSKEQVHRLIRDSFHLSVMEAPPGEARVGEQFAHSTRLVLIDGAGQIRGYYDTRHQKMVKELRQSARALIEGAATRAAKPVRASELPG